MALRIGETTDCRQCIELLIMLREWQILKRGKVIE